MFKKRIFAALLVLLCILGMPVAVSAAEVDCDAVYCFSETDFAGEEEDLTGVCITQLPESHVGTVMLGARVLRPGDILTVDQVAQMTFCPLRTEEDVVATVCYLPIYEDRVAPADTMSIAVRGKEDQKPIAEDFALETYKNLPNTAQLKAKDPEGEQLTYTVTRQPRRGEVVIHSDGTFTYTPKKNKVGVDSFTYTAADPAGNVSREATVTITILKPTQSTLYTDTVGTDCRFTAEWMKNTGIFEGENLVGNLCFQPEKTVTRGEFVTMLVKALDIPVEENAAYTGYADEIPAWLRPYLAAAVRSGLTADLPFGETFGANEPITGGEAAVMLQNALDLSVEETASDELSDVPAWAQTAVSAVAGSGIAVSANAPLTRAEAANMLYQASILSQSAPGMDVIRAQQ